MSIKTVIGTAIGEFDNVFELTLDRFRKSARIKDAVTIGTERNTTCYDIAIITNDEARAGENIVIMNENCIILKNMDRLERVARRAQMERHVTETDSDFAGRVYVRLVTKLGCDLHHYPRSATHYADYYVISLPMLARASVLPKELNTLNYYSRLKSSPTTIGYNYEIDVDRKIRVPLGTLVPADVRLPQDVILVSPEPVGDMVYFPRADSAVELKYDFDKYTSFYHEQNTQRVHYSLFDNQRVWYLVMSHYAQQGSIIAYSKCVLHVLNKAAILIARIVRCGGVHNYKTWSWDLPVPSGPDELKFCAAHDIAALRSICHTIAYFDVPDWIQDDWFTIGSGRDPDNMLFRKIGSYLLTAHEYVTIDNFPFLTWRHEGNWCSPFSPDGFFRNKDHEIIRVDDAITANVEFRDLLENTGGRADIPQGMGRMKFIETNLPRRCSTNID